MSPAWWAWRIERRARAAGLDWPQVEALSDDGLEARLYGAPTPPTHHRPVPDCTALHVERHKPGVTLELLHLEYLEQHPDGYRSILESFDLWLNSPTVKGRNTNRLPGPDRPRRPSHRR